MTDELASMRAQKKALKEAAFAVLPRGATCDDVAAYLLRFTDSNTRLDELFAVKYKMVRPDWLRLLGENWAQTDNVAAFIPELEAAIGKKRPALQMMDAAELAAFDKLRDPMCVYRGCGSNNAAGICWSLDRNAAVRFPFSDRYNLAERYLITGSVQYSQIVALKLDRGEKAIISFDVKLLKRERLFLDDGNLRTELVE